MEFIIIGVKEDKQFKHIREEIHNLALRKNLNVLTLPIKKNRKPKTHNIILHWLKNYFPPRIIGST